MAFILLAMIRGLSTFRKLPELLKISNYFHEHKIPYYTTCQRMGQRVAASVLAKVGPIDEPWFAISDCSIGAGNRKNFTVLRVPQSNALKAFQAHRGLTLKDCEVIHFGIMERTTNEDLCAQYKACFKKVGEPAFLVSDGGEVRAGWEEYQRKTTSAEDKRLRIQDLGHVLANALKRYYSDLKWLKDVEDIVQQGSALLRQTEYAYLIPASLRNKSRYMNLSLRIMGILRLMEANSGSGQSEQGSLAELIRDKFPGLSSYRKRLEDLCRVLHSSHEVMGHLKTNGFCSSKSTSWQDYLTLLGQSSALDSYPSTVLKELNDLLLDWQRVQLASPLWTVPLPISRISLLT